MVRFSFSPVPTAVAGALLGLMLLASAGPVRAQSIQTLTFDEVATQSANGLSVKGVRFDFRVGGLVSPDALYNAAGPGALTFLSDPVLDGDAAGVLTLDFLAPTSLLRFGLALSSTSAINGAASIQLFGPSQNVIGTFSLNTAPLVGVSEGQFQYAGAPIVRAVIDFNEAALPNPLVDPSAPPRRFALDNLSVQPIPEPGTLALLGAGTFALPAGAVLRARRRRCAQTDTGPAA